MSPLIEEARRRQRRRRIALAALVVLAAGLAAVVALLHRGSAPAQRQAQPQPAVVIESAPGGAVIRLRPASRRAGDTATVLRALVERAAHPRTTTVMVNPKTGAVTLVTTTTPR